jgi:hypothetical protein
MAGISLDLFKQCNPSIRPSVYSQQKEIPLGYSVSFPDTVSIEKVQLALAALKSQLPQESSEKGAYYTVRRGDNLIGIARKYGVSPSELASINSIGKITGSLRDRSSGFPVKPKYRRWHYPILIRLLMKLQIL